jgi:hypothetical protein
MIHNVVYEQNQRVICLSAGIKQSFCTSMFKYLDSLCCLSGTTYQSNILASLASMKNIKKPPIFLNHVNDYLIPLSNTKNGGSFWFSARNYLSCYEDDGHTYIKFKDKMIIKTDYSKFTILQQYRKYLDLDIIRKEKIESYGY